jgi:formate hydrogenlyase subunit 3/multisubunit Na+/H+ antiporter MnhD subunit
LPWLAPHPGLGLDHIGQVFLGFASALWLAAAWYARSHLVNDRSASRFFLFFLLAMAGNFGVILAQDIPTFYAGFAIMGFASTGLVLHHGDRGSVRAGTIYIALALLGEVLLFAGFAFLASHCLKSAPAGSATCPTATSTGANSSRPR